VNVKDYMDSYKDTSDANSRER